MMPQVAVSPLGSSGDNSNSYSNKKNDFILLKKWENKIFVRHLNDVISKLAP